MKAAARILLVTYGCLLPSQAQSAARAPTRLTTKQTTTLRVGELAVLSVPSDRRYTYSADGPNGDWRDVLTVVRRSKRQMTFRATATGKGVIILSPDVLVGGCVSCATHHYFVEVVSSRKPH